MSQSPLYQSNLSITLINEPIAALSIYRSPQSIFESVDKSLAASFDCTGQMPAPRPAVQVSSSSATSEGAAAAERPKQPHLETSPDADDGPRPARRLSSRKSPVVFAKLLTNSCAGAVYQSTNTCKQINYSGLSVF